MVDQDPAGYNDFLFLHLKSYVPAGWINHNKNPFLSFPLFPVESIKDYDSRTREESMERKTGSCPAEAGEFLVPDSWVTLMVSSMRLVLVHAIKVGTHVSGIGTRVARTLEWP